MPRKKISGTVVSSSGNKTVVVKVVKRVKHNVYQKVISKIVKYHAHDEDNKCQVGDIVQILEHAPISKKKRWMVL